PASGGEGETRMQANVSVSIGVAMFPGHSRHSAELLRMADKAMYEVKREGKNGVRMAPGLQ
ncbi:MAG: diguanylate cyclase, partial [Idiomarina sp.]|nr:diguanylate cyclase [Idiomarina sp.]